MTQHNHTEFVPGCFRCDLSRTEAELRTDLPPMGEDGLVMDVERDIDPWVLPDDWSGWVFAGALGWKRVTNLGWTEGGQLRAMWFEIPVDNRIAYCVPLAGAVPMVVRDDG